MKYIYVISTFTQVQKDKNDWLDFGDVRSVCWTDTFEDALNIVANNVCDIFECYYKYAVIETVPQCLYPTTATSYERNFFEWNPDGEQYEPTHEVEQLINETRISPVFCIG